MNFEFPASTLDFKSMFIAYLLKTAAQRFKRSIAAFLEFVFIHGCTRVPRSDPTGKEVGYS